MTNAIVRKQAMFSLVVGVASVLFAGSVEFKEDSITLPTYAPGGYDRTPIFYTGRVYQGAQGRVYPYPMQDVLHDGKVDETYKYLTLENEWLQMGLLPEHGGHLLNFTDKRTGFETFYRQHVVKPALIGMLGAWISGGVEWNFPHHHRATTAMPIDWRATDDPAEFGDCDAPKGTKTVWIGETELRRRLKWTIGLSLMPDRAVLQADNRFMNRGPFIESMIYWANVSVHCGDDYQILFPPSCHLGFDHHKNYWTSFPIGPRKEEVELLPSQRSKYADDISGTMDLSWWKNFTIESRSIFAMDPDNAWLAGYDHRRQCGTAHVSNRHVTVGKKFFLWGNFPEAHVWDTVLTDSDGPYLELMVGCWSDNQPDYSWIAPYETRRVKQYWFPVKGIGGVKNVTVDGAVNVDRRGKEELLVGFHSTRVLTNCTVRVVCGERTVFAEKGVAIDPDTPWCKPVKVSADAADQELTASIADADGRVFLSYTPVGPDPHDPLPPKVENPKEPGEYASAELAYEVGLRLDQFHNGILDPEPYYGRALEIDPDYTRANLAMGVRRLKSGMYAEAKPYLEKAVKRATQNHTRALDAAPEYYLALAERGLGNLKRAEDLLWRCTWRASYKKEALFEIVRICLLQNRRKEAHDLLESSLLPLAMDEAKFHTLHAYMHRNDCRKSAAKAQREAFRCDPLEYWGQCEEVFREGGDGAAALGKAEKNRGLKAQQLMECICDYWGIGAWDEVIALCDAALGKAASEKPYATEGALPLKDTIAACDSYRNPMFGYFKAYAMERKGKIEKVEAELLSVEQLDWIYCFPSRLEELAVLQWVASRLSRHSQLSQHLYLLGCVLWNMDQKDAGLAAWRKAVAANPRHALAWRCLGFALSHPGTYFTNTGVPSGVANREAYDCYLKSLEAEPHFRTLDEAGKLAERLNLPAEERLALMEKYRSTVEKYDPCILRLAYTYNAVGDHAKAHEILTTRRFHVWEGADGLLAPFVESCIGLGQAAMKARDYATALKYFEESTTYPANLQAGRPGDAGTEPKSRYFMAQCKKALGDSAGCRAELEKSLKGWIHAGEMDYWRVKALRELGREAECAPLIAELKQAIAELESPPPTVINAYAKFAGENSAMERAAKAREKAYDLKALLQELEPGADEAFNDYSDHGSLRRFPLDRDLGEGAASADPTGCPAFAVEPPRSREGAVVRAADFGLSADSDDNAAAINAAIAEAKRIGARGVELSPGVYRCFGERGVFLEGFEDFTFDGKGAELVFRRKPVYPIIPSWDHDPDRANFVIRDCRRVRVGGFDMDWDWKTMPLATCAKCIGFFVDEKKDNASYIDFELIGHERHPLYGKGFPVQKVQCMTEDFRHFRQGSMLWEETYEGDYGCKAEWLGPTRVRIYPKVRDVNAPHFKPAGDPRESVKANREWAKAYKVGETVRIKHCYYGKGAFSLISNSDFDLHDVRVYSCFGWGAYIGGTQHRWSMRNVTYMPRDWRHPVSSSSDTIHFVRSRGESLLENITVGFEDDDAINVHDRFTVAKRVGADTLEVILKRGARYFLPGVGNEVELRLPGYGPTGWFGRVKRLEGERIVFDRQLPAEDPKEGWFLVFDRTDASDRLIIRNCRLEDMEMRTLVNVSDVTVENCVFRRTNGDALRMLADYTLTYWCEGMGTTNIVVRNCTFEDNSVREEVSTPWSLGADLAICLSRPPQVEKSGLWRDYISNILVENCRFRNSLGYFADFRFGRDITLRGNVIERDGKRAACRATSGSVRLENVHNVRLENNVFRPLAGAEPPAVFAADDVKGLVLRGNRVLGSE